MPATDRHFFLGAKAAHVNNQAGNGVCHPAWENRLMFSADDSYE